MRINKFLASCGIASRRKSEEFVTSGKVKVNGETVLSLSTDVDPENDVVELSGRVVSLQNEKVYYMLNKPKGYICTKFDKAGRKTIYDLISSSVKQRVFSVGRLDWDTEGLLILTNDGDLANALMHPRGEIDKTYVAKISGEFGKDKQKTLEAGVTLDDGFKTSPAKIANISKENNKTKLEITIHEGKNRQIRRMFASVGCEVEFLKRTKFAGLNLGSLKRGEIRSLSKSEVQMLKSEGEK